MYHVCNTPPTSSTHILAPNTHATVFPVQRPSTFRIHVARCTITPAQFATDDKGQHIVDHVAYQTPPRRGRITINGPRTQPTRDQTTVDVVATLVAGSVEGHVLRAVRKRRATGHVVRCGTRLVQGRDLIFYPTSITVHFFHGAGAFRYLVCPGRRGRCRFVDEPMLVVLRPSPTHCTADGGVLSDAFPQQPQQQRCGCIFYQTCSCCN